MSQTAITARIHERREEIARRRMSIAQQMQALQHESALLDREDADLAITERTINRLLPDGTPPVAMSCVVTDVLRHVDPAPSREKRKPDGTPSVVEMARTLLVEAAARGDAWMETTQIVEEIRRRWWPDAENADIAPQLWRAAARQGVLVKDANSYALPGAIGKGPAAMPTEPSQRDGAAGSDPA